ncbi:uncharacterized protein LOC124949722 isoform X1 [Vespa velutina]|uniref:uncharacterized protein LOC124949722 isoform X1 n=1 Tax=Vespa velutina TaxID=202808 RepID=UPI001FB28F85|nr:uncharacterized protein LOC124949722 isoform X1 [Vespa velutina]
MATRKVNVNDVLLTVNLFLFFSFLIDAKKLEDIVQESSGGLPFLQFTKDGVRVNFAGYHAETGLGGLLGNSQTGGGLHASAGTPFGPQASAGLGGLLNGDNANTGGGLYAQAGLGHNRPAARAGLGGILDGSGNSNNPIAGILFADAGLGKNQPAAKAGLAGILDGSGNSNNPIAGTLFADAGLGNNQPAAKAGLAGILDGSGNSNNPIAGTLFADAGLGNNQPAVRTSDNVYYDTVPSNAASIKPSTSHTNIQLISGSIPKNHKSQRAINSKSVVLINEPIPESKYFPEAGTSAELYANTGYVNGKSHVSAFENVQKIPTSRDKSIEEDRKINESTPLVNGLISSKGVVEANAGANGNAAVGNNVNTAQEQPVLNHWYLRKRFRSGPLRKQILHSSSVIPVSVPIPASTSSGTSGTASGGVSASASGEIISRVNADSSTGSDITFVGSKTYKPGSFFDDIFNIPISTLTAVNQLLRNNVG